MSIKGINFKGHEIKNVLFADDATFITDGNERSFTTLVDVLDNGAQIMRKHLEWFLIIKTTLIIHFHSIYYQKLARFVIV